MSGSNAQYPPQTGPYKVVTHGKSYVGLTDTAVLDISVGQPYHEGEKLKAMVDWAAERFARVTISVADTLQRYNFPHRSEELACSMGEEWLNRNADILAGVQSKCDLNITRWDQWRNDERFYERFEIAEDLYHNSKTFKTAVDKALRNDRGYILEEVAVISMMVEDIGGVHIYPGTFLEVWDLFKQGLDKELPMLGDYRFSRIDFRKNRNYTPAFEKAMDSIAV